MAKIIRMNEAGEGNIADHLASQFKDRQARATEEAINAGRAKEEDNGTGTANNVQGR